MKTKLPKEIVVTVENEGEGKDEFLKACEKAEETAELGAVKRGGIYVLKRVVTISVVTVVKPV